MIKKTIRNRIMMLTVAVIFLFGILATIFVFYFSRNTFINNEKDNLQEVVKEMSHEIEKTFEYAQALIYQASQQQEIIDFLKENPDNADNLLQEYLAQYNVADAYSSLYLMNTDGLTIAATDPSFVGNNYGFRFYFREALAGRQGVDVVLGVTTKQLGYYFSSPVLSADGEILGVLVGKLKPEIINSSFDNREHQESNIMFTDSFGVVIYAQRLERIYKSLAPLTREELEVIEDFNRFGSLEIKGLQYDVVMDSIRRGDDDGLFDIFDDEDNEREILAMAKIEMFPFYLVAEEDAELYIQSALSISYLLSLFVLLAALIAGFFISFLISFYLRPLKNLYDGAMRLGQGDFSVKIPKSGTSVELDELADVFNKTVINIKKSRAEVDHKVKEQTKELAAKSNDLEDRQQAMLNILEDMAKEKEKVAQEGKKISAVLESIGDAVFVINRQGKIILFNQAAEEICGQNSVDVLGKEHGKVFSFLNSEDHKKDYFIKKAVDSGEPVSNDIKGILVVNGEDIPVAATAAPWLDENKQVRGCVVVFRDVRKEREIDRAKTEFVSLASHQLRTPLSAINWYTEMLMDEDAGQLNKEQHKYLDEIYRGNQRMVALVNSLLNVSRLELGTFAVEPTKAQVVDICRSVLNELKAGIKKRKLTVKASYPKKLEKIKIDVSLVRIIFQNLLSNAVKYTPVGGKININIEKKDPNLLITVSDTGLGIPKKQQSEIFKKLFRADNVRETDTEGTGLGLYIVKAILEVTGGAIWFESHVNKGTTFYVTIPLSGMTAHRGDKKLNQ